MRTPFVSTALLLITCFGLTKPIWAQTSPVSTIKQISLISPAAPGGSSDVAFQLFAHYFSKYLPGRPVIVPQAMPGAHGVSAHNYFSHEARPDGSTIIIMSNSEIDPMTSRAPQARYDPTKYGIIGGLSFGDNILIVRRDAQPRLLDKSRPPVIVGSVAGAPRSGIQMAIWGRYYLGWNEKWVTGYPGSADLQLALERGEIDMTSFPRYFVKDKLLDRSKYEIIYLDGLLQNAPPSGRVDADDAPRFVDAMKGKIKDPKMLAAYDYWRASKLFKALALPPGTPAFVLAVYRKAFHQMAKDPDFLRSASAGMGGSAVLSESETTKFVSSLVAVPDQAIRTTQDLLLNP
jgi:hypothetical protein